MMVGKLLRWRMGASQTAASTDYEKRVASQIAQYADTVDMHSLPAIFHVWSHNYLRPGMEQVFGSSDLTSFYVNAYIAARPQAQGRILSIGCGDGTIEVDIAKALCARGLDFELLAADLSPLLLNRARTKIAEAHLGKHVKAIEVDLNDIALDGPFDVIMANHSLHHIVGLEQLFDFARIVLTDQGVFATQDMIGRNGHQRWPETRAILEALWPTLAEKQRYHTQLKRLDLEFRDHDCSGEGFEGIRAQDILSLLLERLHPMRFFASGGFIDPIVDRGYGHGWDTNSERDVATIHWLSKLNDMLLDAGVIKPTIMMAWFGKHPAEERYFRSRSARASVRSAAPSWVVGG
jgi:SAM-dependent methyltransferase